MADAPTPNGTSALTVAGATEVFKGLLSSSGENTETLRETPPDSDEESPESEGAEETGAAPDEGEDAIDADDAEDDGEPEEPTEEPLTFKVPAGEGGAEIEVPVEELTKGYLRQADYTRKTQALAEQRKAQEAEFLGVAGERAQYAERLAALDETLRALTPAEPDWDALRMELDPGEFGSTWAQWQQHKSRLQDIATQREAAESKVMEDFQKARIATLEAESAKLVEVIPEWKDESKAVKDRADLVSYAREQGYTPADLADVTDHRVVVLLRKAMLYDRLQKAKPSVEQKIKDRNTDTSPAAKPGAAPISRRAPSDNTRARQRLAKTGSIHDAASVFLTQLD